MNRVDGEGPEKTDEQIPSPELKAATAAEAAAPKAKAAPKAPKAKAAPKAPKAKAAPKAPKAKAAPKAPKTKEAGKVWRFGFMKSPKNKDVYPRVGKDGKLSARVAKRLKAKAAPKWGRIRSANRKAALTALKAGKGEWFTTAKGETA